jgi:hypothetical protein
MYKNLYGLAVAVGFATSPLCIASPANADPYKWCAVYQNGSTNCGFVTIEQCRATVSGAGGSCQPNQFYTAPSKTSSEKPSPTKRTATHHQRERPLEGRAQVPRAPEDRVPTDRFQSQ